MTRRLKAGIVEPEETSFIQRLGKHVPAATNINAKKLLGGTRRQQGDLISLFQLFKIREVG
jgi:hypothetical protein